MKITSVNIKISCENKCKAYISLVVDEALFIDNIKVIYDNQKQRYFLSMPSILDSIKNRHDVFHPINEMFRQNMETFLVQFYKYTYNSKKNYLKMILKDEDKNTCISQQSISDFQECDKEFDNDVKHPIFSVTSFRIRSIDSNSNLCAIASFIIDSSFVVNNLKIVLDKYTNDYKLYMPQYETKANKKKEIIHPVSRLVREKLEELLLTGYKSLLVEKTRELIAESCNHQNIPLYMQSASDFDYKYENTGCTSKIMERSEHSYCVAEMSESFEESVYREPSTIIERIIQNDNQKYMSGKIVGYIDNEHYKVELIDGKIGSIECNALDSREKITDYKRKVFCEYTPMYDEQQKEKYFLKHINKDYYFEVIGENTDNNYILSIEKVKRDFLDYVIEHSCILRGEIVQIGERYVGIEVPFGYVFFTLVEFVFGCKYDSTFDYTNYIGSEASVIVMYEKETNKLYPQVANKIFNYQNYNTNYIFPTLTLWDSSYYSKLWLDKQLLLCDKHKKYPLKNINQLVVIGNLREKGELKKTYKGNIRKIFSEKDASRYRKNILAIEWMINLKGYNVKDAIEFLERKGYSYSIRYSYSFENESGTVLSMQPSINEKTIIPRNVIVELTISQGKRKEYIIPNFVGMNIKEVRDILNNNKINLKYKISNSKTTGIDNNCIIQTWPPSGKTILSGKTINVTIYQEKNYESPFVLREKEHPIINYNSKVLGTEKIIRQFVAVPWQKSMLTFILKHKVATSLQLKQWISFQHYSEESKIDETVKYLQSISMLGSVSLGSDVSKTTMQFLFPVKNLYAILREGYGYNGRFSHSGKDARYYKTRAAENQAFLKLYSILKNDNIIEYEVDCIQNFTYEDAQQHLKIHIGINTTDILNNGKNLYFIEAIRFFNDEQILEAWDKLVRYNMYISKKYMPTPYLLLVFEDEVHFKTFITNKPLDFKFQHIKLFYTWDLLTNTDIENFDDIFKKEDTLC